MTTRRLFLAVDLSIAVVEKLVALQEELDERIRDDFEGVRVRWTDAPNIHVTLKFLGDTEASLVSLLEETLAGLVEPLFPFEVHCRGLGVFPHPTRPRILWAGLEPEGAEVMGLLQQAIDKDLGELGFQPEEREYRPHITLGRVKTRNAPSLGPIVDTYRELTFGSSYIRDIVLYASTLTDEGPRYEVVNRFGLGD